MGLNTFSSISNYTARLIIKIINLPTKSLSLNVIKTDLQIDLWYVHGSFSSGKILLFQGV